MVAGINVAAYANEDFTDLIYEIVKTEAVRLHKFDDLEIVLAGKVAAYTAMIPILAIASGGKLASSAELNQLLDKLFQNISEIGDKHE